MKNVLLTQQIISVCKKQNKPVVFITGVTGQDGSYMVDYLLKNYPDRFLIVCGVRRNSSLNDINIKHVSDKDYFLTYFDLTDSGNINSLIENIKPAYFINFGGQSFVGTSWDLAKQTFETNAISMISILDAIRKYSPTTKFYQAGSSEEFGNVEYSPQDEKHPLKPRSPYGASKAAARLLLKTYRESYNLYAVAGWLFNHESERRGPEFVTRKITIGVAKIDKDIKAGNTITTIKLGNINTQRDWSHAEDMVDGVWRMLNQEVYNKELGWIGEFDGIETLIYDASKHIKDYVLGSGETHTIKEFVKLAFQAAGYLGNWHEFTEGEEVFVLASNDMIVVEVDKKLYRPAEVNHLIADNTLAKEELRWKPQVSFKELVSRMVINDINLIK
jgi:GDPmannose 4,6-dehydratase